MNEPMELPDRVDVLRVVRQSFWLGLFLPGLAQMLALRIVEGVIWLGALFQAWLWGGWKAALVLHVLSGIRCFMLLAHSAEQIEQGRSPTSAQTHAHMH
jgi:hypothetical protein